MDKVNAPKTPKGVITIYSDEEVSRMITACGNTRDKIIIAMYANTGLRATELSDTATADIDVRRKIVKVHGKGSKERVIPFNGVCHDLMTTYGFESEHMDRLSYSGTYKMVQRVCKRAGVESRGLHCFRHTFACNYLMNGGDPLCLRVLLGHSSLAMTDHYSQWVSQERAIENYRKTFDGPTAGDTGKLAPATQLEPDNPKEEL
ncbi:MAG: tyrosine-type recombinase/integrase [Dehalococcoidia bacterium]|nr:tyrosine-type recombinase/integrase [Dehalococcoidia bacterium]